MIQKWGGWWEVTLTWDVTGSWTWTVDTTLSNTTVTPWSYTGANITVDSKGRITSASNWTGWWLTMWQVLAISGWFSIY